MTTIMSHEPVNLDDYLPSVADFPRPGVVFRVVHQYSPSGTGS